MMKDQVFEQKTGFRSMVKERKDSSMIQDWFGAYLCADLVQIYVPIWAVFMTDFSAL
jgi:hypothetical protein